MNREFALECLKSNEFHLDRTINAILTNELKEPLKSIEESKRLKWKFGELKNQQNFPSTAGSSSSDSIEFQNYLIRTGRQEKVPSSAAPSSLAQFSSNSYELPNDDEVKSLKLSIEKSSSWMYEDEYDDALDEYLNLKNFDIQNDDGEAESGESKKNSNSILNEMRKENSQRTVERVEDRMKQILAIAPSRRNQEQIKFLEKLQTTPLGSNTAAATDRGESEKKVAKDQSNHEPARNSGNSQPGNQIGRGGGGNKNNRQNSRPEKKTREAIKPGLSLTGRELDPTPLDASKPLPKNEKKVELQESDDESGGCEADNSGSLGSVSCAPGGRGGFRGRGRGRGGSHNRKALNAKKSQHFVQS